MANSNESSKESNKESSVGGVGGGQESGQETGSKRGPKGRFLPGHKFSVGRSSPRRVESAYLVALGDVATPDRLAELASSMLTHAIERGTWREQHSLFRLLLDQLEGKPVQRILTARADTLSTLLSKLADNNNDNNNNDNNDKDSGEVVDGEWTDGGDG